MLNLYADGIEAGIQRDLAQPPRQLNPSFSMWAALTGGAKGLAQGGLEGMASSTDAARWLEDLAYSNAGVYADRALHEKNVQRLQTQSAAERRSSKDYEPDPATAHTAEQVLHGISRLGGKAAVAMSVAGPYGGGVALAGEEANTQYRELIAKGIDPETAAKVAGVQGVAAGASIALPMVGPTIKSTVALGLVGGPGAYVAQEATAKRILDKAGYHDEASLHDPTDPLGLTIATLLPGIFGTAHAVGLARGRAKPGLVDVVQDIESGGKRFDKNGQLLASSKGALGEMQVMPATARDPGLGVTPARDGSPEELARVGRDYLGALQKRYPGDDAKTMAAYNAGPGAVDRAIAQHGGDWLSHLPTETQAYVAKGSKLLEAGELAHAAADPATVDAARARTTDAALQRSLPNDPEARARVIQASDELGAGRMPQVRPIADDVLIEQRFATKLEDHPAAVAEYATRPDSEGGRILNTDIARELSPDYLSDRTRSAAVHEPASAFIKRRYAEMLQEPPKPGQEPFVLFTAGGTGAGKTTAIQGLPQVSALAQRAQIVYDTNMNKLASGRQKIDQALEAGKGVTIVMVTRDPEDALVHGALPRARRQEEEFGTGRTVPLREHIHTHVGALETVRELARLYADNPRVSIKVVDNSLGRGNQVERPLQWLNDLRYNDVERRVTAALEREREADRISSAVYEGFAGRSRMDPGTPEGVRGVQSGDRPGDGRLAAQGDRGTASAEVTPADPDAKRVEAIATQYPDLRVKLPGSDQTLSVAAALERARAEHAEELKAGDLVKAAVQCALNEGAAAA